MLSQAGLRLSHYAPNTVMAPHSHDEASLNIVIGGHFTEQICGSERRYARGTVTFYPAGAVHSQVFGARGARQIIIRLAESCLYYLGDSRTDLAISPWACSPQLDALGGRLLQEMHAGDAFSALACEGLMLEIVAAFGRSGMAPVAAAPPAWLTRAREFIQEHACKPVTLRSIAQAAGRHEIHLAREFRRYFGLSVGGYVRQLRAQRAALLLRQPHADLTRIALDCGFSSHAHLCREFKARFGVTPSQYRARPG